MRVATTLALLLVTPALRAQTPGNCAPGRAEAVLDVNDVRAAVFNTGSLFYGNEFDDGTGYLVADSLESPLFAAGIWVGGRVGGELRVAGSTFDRFEFWPGPLPADGTPPDAVGCAGYDRIYRVSRGDVARFAETGTATADLRDWPVELGAPVLDGDGDPTNYDLAAGDEPALSGDQTAFWVMNDAGNEHRKSGTLPMGLEVRVEAFAKAWGEPALHQATFYRYRLTHRGPAPLDSAYVAFFAETDLGDAVDDYVGSDTTAGLGFTYNADDEDGDGSGQSYGAAPPAFGVAVLRGPAALPNGRDNDGDGEADEPGERHGLTTVSYFGSGPLDHPAAPAGVPAYRRMQGLWNDGTPITEGGDGYQEDGPVRLFAFPGDPVTGACWSEFDPCNGPAIAPSDRSWMVATGPFRLEPGQTEEVVFALVFARGADHLDSVTELRRATRYVRTAYEGGLLDPQRVTPVPPTETPDAIALSHPAPNPFTDATTLRYTLPEAMAVRLAVYDVLGREVAVLADGVQEAGPHAAVFDGAGLAPGVYLARFEAGGAVRTLRLTKR